MQRLAYIEIARAICIVLVVAGHYMPDDSPGWYVKLNSLIYSFHMPLFMYVSGYVHRYSSRRAIRYADFVRKRFNRLMIPYFLTSVFIITVKLLTEDGLHVEHPVSPSSFLEMCYLPSAGFFLWFVYTLFLIFLIVPLFNTKKKLYFLFAVSLVLFALPGSFTPLFCLEQLRLNLVYFVLGCILFEESRTRAAIEKKSAILLIAVFSALFLLDNLYPDVLHTPVEPFRRLCLAVSGIFMILGISRYLESKEGPCKRLLLRLSVYSYTIYLLHTTAGGFVKALLVKISVDTYLNGDFSFIIQAAAVIASGIVIPVVLHRAYCIIKEKIR